MAASATSYASSTVCGTIVRSVCSRSQGQSRRSRSVSAWRSTSASARLNSGRLGRRSREGGAGIWVGLVTHLVLDPRVAAEELPGVLVPLGHLFGLALLLEL